MVDWTLIDKSLNGGLSDAENAQLEQWLAESQSHRRYYENVCRQAGYSLSDEVFGKWREEFSQTLASLNAAKRRRRTLRIARTAAAAAVLAGVVLISGLWRQSQEQVEPVVPGSPKAELRLADGNTVKLDADQSRDIATGSAEILSRDNTITYNAAEHSDTGTNTLTTKRGGEWTVVLSDGTRVYLNAASELKYPVAFTGGTRTVELQGEAYFEVAHDSSRPFIVNAGGTGIRVLGTEFNVKAYPHDATTWTTLVEGRVEVECAQGQYIIEPGQQLSFDRTSGAVEVKEVDTQLFTSWKEGVFRFYRTRLEEVLGTLSLWYDIDVVYEEPSVRDIVFSASGPLPRYDEISSLLKKFEYTGDVSFRLEGRVLTVGKR